MNSPEEVFRDNLRRLTAAYDLDFEGIAAALGFGREDKKWLSRVWLNGLTRADSRSRGRLNRMANLFGLKDPSHMWIPDVESDPERLAKTRTMLGDNQWLTLVSKVANAMRILDRLWQSYPYEMARIWSKYGDNNKMIACWVAEEYGSHRISIEERELTNRIEKEFADALQLETTTVPIGRISNRVRQHPAYDNMAQQMCQLLDLYKDEDNPASMDDTKLEPYLLNGIRECMSRPLSGDEIYERFVKRYLCADDSDDDSTEAEMIRSVIAELATHPEWHTHVRRAYSGDFFAVETAIAEKWKEARTKSSHSISVERFVHFYKSNILDEFVSHGETEPGDLGGRRRQDS